ncbi:PA2169 family four-helix-bundle protein [Clostridium algoriphilum]|uniref:DUF2383 domain-containing protein n=1 Tax=Clostridium algoriphilum TaxID=198347 RepID=UPI001CF5FCB0|nr:DUF2383 domain-containing protein [Clostridium algoriphilum]MCB2293254.1 PA2169 family four-helix-bundle protein [Clostridium algoriphilum]
MNSKNIKSLNTILEGEYMAIKSFDALIEHANAVITKNELQKIQQTHRHHASQICTKIQNLGGNPSESVGIQGVVAETISNIKHIGTTDNTAYLKEALQDEYMGIKAIKELLADNTNSSSSKLLNNIITQHQTNINSLNTLISTTRNAQ